MNPVTGLSLGRIAFGVVAFAKPGLVGKLLQIELESNPQLLFLARLFGSRDAVLGLATLLASGKARRNLVLAGIAVDAADAVTGYLAMREGTVSRKAALAILTPAVGAVGSGFAGLRRR